MNSRGSLTQLVPVLIAIATSIALFAPVAAGAHPDHIERPVAQNPALLAAVVNLGGGADHFSGTTFRHAISATAAGEEQVLRRSIGPAMVRRFDDAFGYMVRDGVATMKHSGKPLPAPSATDGRTVAIALYQAGLHDGTFDVERLFDTLFSPAVHSHAMIAVGRKYGAGGETAYHVVFARLVQDVGKQ